MNLMPIIQKYRKEGNFLLSSGQISKEYFDIKEAMGDPNNLEEFLSEIFYRIKEKPEVVIGLEFGGIPLAIGLALKLHVPFAILRKQKNNHGMERRLEGYQGKGKVIVLDDVRTLGTTMSDALVWLVENGYTIIQWETILDRQNLRAD